MVDDGSGNMGAVSKGQTVELTLAELQALYASGKDAAGNFAIDMTTDKFASVPICIWSISTSPTARLTRTSPRATST